MLCWNYRLSLVKDSDETAKKNALFQHSHTILIFYDISYRIGFFIGRHRHCLKINRIWNRSPNFSKSVQTFLWKSFVISCGCGVGGLRFGLVSQANRNPGLIRSRPTTTLQGTRIEISFSFQKDYCCSAFLPNYSHAISLSLFLTANATQSF